MLSTVSYDIRRGEYWQRLIVVKDKRTHRQQNITEASATLTDVYGDVVTVDCTVHNGTGILMILDQAETLALNDGEYAIEVFANPHNRLDQVAIGPVKVVTMDSTDILDDDSLDPILDEDNIIDIIDGGAP